MTSMGRGPANYERLDRFLGEAGLDAVVTARPENIRYLTGFDSFLINQRHEVALAVYARGGEVALVAPIPEIPRVFDAGLSAVHIQPYGNYVVFDREREAGEMAAFFRTQKRTALPTIEEALESTLTTIASPRCSATVDLFGLTEAGRSRIESSLQSHGHRLALGGSILEWSRMVKTPRELTLLDESVQITEDALEAVMSAAAPGLTERDLADVFTESVTKRGAGISHWTGTVGPDRGWTVCDPGDRRLAPGDTVRLDGGCIRDGYRADIGCTIVVGGPDPGVAEIHTALEAGFRAAVETARVGTNASEVFRVAVETAREHGLVDYERGDVGHGIGLDAYELPILRKSGTPSVLFDGDRDDFELEPGMVLCIELPYPAVSLAGFQVERTFVTTPGGAQRLGRLPVGLMATGTDDS